MDGSDANLGTRTDGTFVGTQNKHDEAIPAQVCADP